MDFGDIIIKPIISEKSIDFVGKGKFTFLVSKKADKKMIKKAIEEKFKVNVLSISTNIIKGGKIRVGTRRTMVEKPSKKKAVVKLAKDQKIDLFDVGA